MVKHGRKDFPNSQEIIPADPALGGLPLPTQSPFDGQQIVVSYGWAWYAYLERILTRLTFSDAWQGDDNEQAQATNWTQHLIDLLATPVNDLFRFRFTEDCALQYSVDNGVTWHDVEGWPDYSYICFRGEQGIPGPPGTSYPPGNTGEGSSPDSDTPVFAMTECDLDLLFGFTYQLVEFMNTMILDLFQVLETATNLLERIESFADEIPILGTFLDLLNKIQDELKEGYEAAYDEGMHANYACGLFCLARANGCSLTWQQITDYFADQIEANPLLDVASIAYYIATGTWVGDLPSHVMFFLVSFVINKGGQWANMTLQIIQVIISTFWNDGNSDWLLLCAECPPAWRATWDIADLGEHWEVNPALPVGGFTEGVGWHTTNIHAEGFNMTRCYIILPFAAPRSWHLTKASYTFTAYTYGDGNNGEWMSAAPPLYAEPLHVKPQPAGTYERNFNHDYVDQTHMSVDFRTNHGYAYGGSANLSQVIIWGTGEPPVEVINTATELVYL